MQTKQLQTTEEEKKWLKASRPKFWAVQNVWVAQVSVRRSTEEERGCLTHNVDEGDYQSCSWLFHWSQAAEDSGREYRRAVIVFSGRRGRRGEEGEGGLFEPGVNAVKVVELAYLHPGSARWGDYRHRLHVTRLTASSHVGFERSPSLAGLGLHLTQLWLYKDNGWQTSRPLTNNKAEGDKSKRLSSILVKMHQRGK